MAYAKQGLFLLSEIFSCNKLSCSSYEEVEIEIEMYLVFHLGEVINKLVEFLRRGLGVVS